MLRWCLARILQPSTSHYQQYREGDVRKKSALFLLLLFCVLSLCFGDDTTDTVDVDLDLADSPYIGVWFSDSDLSAIENPTMATSASLTEAKRSLKIDTATMKAISSEDLYLWVKVIGYEGADVTLSCSQPLTNASSDTIQWQAEARKKDSQSAAAVVYSDKTQPPSGVNNILAIDNPNNGAVFESWEIDLSTISPILPGTSGTYTANLTVTIKEKGEIQSE